MFQLAMALALAAFNGNVPATGILGTVLCTDGGGRSAFLKTVKDVIIGWQIRKYPKAAQNWEDMKEPFANSATLCQRSNIQAQ